MIPLALMVFIYALDKYKPIVNGLILGLGAAFHIQFLLTAPLLLPKVVKKVSILFPLAFGFLISLIPVFIFDLRNNFLNWKLLQDFLTGGIGKDYFAFLSVWRNVVGYNLGFDVSTQTGILIYIFIALILYDSSRIPRNSLRGRIEHKISFSFRGENPRLSRGRMIWIERKTSLIGKLMYVWFAFPLLFALYGKRPSEYYFNYLLVIAVIAVGVFVVKIKKIWILLLVAVLMLHLGAKSTERFYNASTGLYRKDEVVRLVGDLTFGMPRFNVSFSLGNEGDTGMKYLMALYGINPTGNSADPLIELTAPPRPNSNFELHGVGIQIHRNFGNFYSARADR